MLINSTGNIFSARKNTKGDGDITIAPFENYSLSRVNIGGIALYVKYGRKNYRIETNTVFKEKIRVIRTFRTYDERDNKIGKIQDIILNNILTFKIDKDRQLAYLQTIERN